jgi:hypothetical protein
VKTQKYILFLVLLCAAPFCDTYSAHGDKNKKVISGKVVDHSTGEGLAGTKIQVKGSDMYCYTDLDGNYLLSMSAEATSEIIIEAAGYEQTIIKPKDLGFNVTIDLIPLK